MPGSDLETAARLYAELEYESAFQILLPLAQGGFVRAQEMVGTMYQIGLGIPKDIDAAFRWLEAAAEAGSGVAAHNLGTLWQTCEPERRSDVEKSLYWFEVARSRGFAPGIFK